MSTQSGKQHVSVFVKAVTEYFAPLLDKQMMKNLLDRP
jgi:hypothetical protein